VTTTKQTLFCYTRKDWIIHRNTQSTHHSDLWTMFKRTKGYSCWNCWWYLFSTV